MTIHIPGRRWNGKTIWRRSESENIHLSSRQPRHRRRTRKSSRRMRRVFLRQFVFFTAVNPMADDQSMEEIRCDLNKPRIAHIQKYLETSSKHSVSAQLKARPVERIAILSNTITRNRSLQHTTFDLY